MKMRRLILIVLLLVLLPCIAQAKIISVSASTQYALALDDNGTVWAWGDNSYGQLGIGTMGGTYGTPQKVLIDNVTQISARGFSSFALKNDGTVYAWGNGDNGRLGYGGTESQSSPVQVKNLTKVVEIAAGTEGCFALKNDGTVWAWGDNRRGEIGDGTTNGDGNTEVSQHFRFIPVQVQGLSDIKMLGEGGDAAIKNDGTVYLWGNYNLAYMNQSHINGFPGSELTPSVVKGLDGITQITSNSGNSIISVYDLCLKNDGAVWGWGDYYYGELGDGTISNGLFPDLKMSSVQTKITDVKQISSMDNHVIALKNDGTVWEWGRYIDRKGWNDNTGLPPTTTSGESMPILVNGLDNVIDVSAGYNFNIALKDDGSVWGWGRNDNNVLGNGKNNVEVSPILLFSSETQPTSTSTATENHTPSNASQGTITPTQTIVSSTPVPTSGFTFSNMAVIGCILLVIGLLSGFRLKKNNK